MKLALDPETRAIQQLLLQMPPEQRLKLLRQWLGEAGVTEQDLQDATELHGWFELRQDLQAKIEPRILSGEIDTRQAIKLCEEAAR